MPRASPRPRAARAKPLDGDGDSGEKVAVKPPAESVSVEPFVMSPDTKLVSSSNQRQEVRHPASRRDGPTSEVTADPSAIADMLRTRFGPRVQKEPSPTTSGTISRGLECLSSTTPDALPTVYTDDPRHDTEDKPMESILQRLRGSTSSDITDMNVSFVLSDLLSPEKVAPDYIEVKRATHRTMTAVIEFIWSDKADLVNDIVSAANAIGTSCRTKIETVLSRTIGTINMDEAGIILLLITTWHRHSDSNRQRLVSTIILDYLRTPTAEVSEWLCKWTSGQMYNTSGSHEQRDFHHGMNRLHPSKDPRSTSHWQDLFMGTVEALSYIGGSSAIEELDTLVRDWLITTGNLDSNPLLASEADSVSMVVSRHAASYGHISSIATRLGLPSKIPDRYDRGRNLINAFTDRPDLLERLDLIEQERDDGADIDWEIAIRGLSEA